MDLDDSMVDLGELKSVWNFETPHFSVFSVTPIAGAAGRCKLIIMARLLSRVATLCAHV